MENIKTEEGNAVLKINPNIYPLDTVYSAAYVFLDKAYVLLDGDPKTKIFVRLKPKGKEDPETMGMDFFNELINYADYRKRSEETRKIREMILQRALVTNDPSAAEDDEFRELFEEIDSGKVEDPEGIAVPWEKKYGKKDDKDKAEQ